MIRRTLFVLLAGAFVAGCLNEEAAPVQTAQVAESAEDAGAASGPAPAAPKEAYQVQAEGGESGSPTLTAYPAQLQTSGPKAPYVQEFAGAFEPQACSAAGGGLPLGGLGLARATQVHALADALAKNDVFSYDIQMTYTNTPESWASLHLWYNLDQTNGYWSERTDETGEITMNFTGQGFALADEPLATVGVDCWYGQVTSPVAYTITVTITFAEGGVPAATPVMLDVPAEAMRLIVRGVAIDPTQGVMSHFRVFAPDDSLVCECALGSTQEVAIQALDVEGKYVVLVDHTDNGFVSLALDAPGEHVLTPLENEFVIYPLVSATGAVDETIEVDLPSTPLNMWAWTFAPGDWEGPPDVGAGHNVKIHVSNARGEVLRIGMVGYATFHAAVPGMLVTNDWYGAPLDGDWEFFVDHHMFDVGSHLVHVQADQMRGDAVMFAQHYVRG